MQKACRSYVQGVCGSIPVEVQGQHKVWTRSAQGVHKVYQCDAMRCDVDKDDGLCEKMRYDSDAMRCDLCFAMRDSKRLNSKFDLDFYATLNRIPIIDAMLMISRIHLQSILFHSFPML